MKLKIQCCLSARNFLILSQYENDLHLNRMHRNMDMSNFGEKLILFEIEGILI